LRRLAVGLLVCLWASSAVADCVEEAHAARARVSTSGPFHFDSTLWNKSLRIRTCGAIDPDRAQHDRSCDPAAGARREKIWIDDRRWENDGAGWLGPYPSLWTHQEKVPATVAFSAAQVSCFERVRFGDRALNKYMFATWVAGRVSLEAVFTDADTGVPVRFETRSDADGTSGSITTYRYDPAIRIEPPVVDTEKRWSTSLQLFAEETGRGDPVCRTKLLAAIARGKAAAFTYEIRGEFYRSCCRSGTFVPPDSIHDRIEGLASWTSRQTIAIGSRAWTKKPTLKEWTEARDGRDEADRIIDGLLPSSEHVGKVTCSETLTVDGRQYQAYEYDFYWDRQSARKFDGVRRVLVDNATGLPFQTIQSSRSGARRWIEMRWYDPTLAIAPPSADTQESLRSVRQMSVDEYHRAMVPADLEKSSAK
jgi:hypothetical protein